MIRLRSLLRFLLRSLIASPLFWLAALALPAGAPAAAPCHHMPAQAAMVHASAHTGAQPRSCAMHGHGHDHGKAGHHADGHDHGRCTSCPACCAGAAPPPEQPAPLDPGPSFVAIPFRAGHVPSVDPALPERPPRPSFA